MGTQLDVSSLPPGAVKTAGSPADSIRIADAPGLAPNEPVEGALRPALKPKPFVKMKKPRSGVETASEAMYPIPFAKEI